MFNMKCLISILLLRNFGNNCLRFLWPETGERNVVMVGHAKFHIKIDSLVIFQYHICLIRGTHLTAISRRCDGLEY